MKSIKTWWNEKENLRLDLADERRKVEYWQRKQEEGDDSLTDLQRYLESARSSSDYHRERAKQWEERAKRSLALLKEQKAYTMSLVRKLNTIRAESALSVSDADNARSIDAE